MSPKYFEAYHNLGQVFCHVVEWCAIVSPSLPPPSPPPSPFPSPLPLARFPHRLIHEHGFCQVLLDTGKVEAAIEQFRQESTLRPDISAPLLSMYRPSSDSACALRRPFLMQRALLSGPRRITSSATWSTQLLSQKLRPRSSHLRRQLGMVQGEFCFTNSKR